MSDFRLPLRNEQHQHKPHPSGGGGVSGASRQGHPAELQVGQPWSRLYPASGPCHPCSWRPHSFGWGPTVSSGLSHCHRQRVVMDAGQVTIRMQKAPPLGTTSEFSLSSGEHGCGLKAHFGGCPDPLSVTPSQLLRGLRL